MPKSNKSKLRETKREGVRKTTRKTKAPRVRHTERYMMCFGKHTGIIDLSNWEGSALYKESVDDVNETTWAMGDKWIYDMRDGDGDYCYVYSKKLCEEMCDMLFDDRPLWF